MQPSPATVVALSGLAGRLPRFGHVGTAARAAQLLEHLLGAAEFDATTGLVAREKAEAVLNAAEAEALLTETIGLNGPGGLPLVYRSRSKARVAIGDIAGGLADAEEAIRITPKFPLELESNLATKQESLPSEPPPNNEGAVTLVVRMPDGSRQGRCFLKSDRLQFFFDFLDIDRTCKPGTYRLEEAKEESDDDMGFSLFD